MNSSTSGGLTGGSQFNYFSQVTSNRHNPNLAINPNFMYKGYSPKGNETMQMAN